LKKKNLNSQTSVKNWKTYPRYLNFNLIKMNWILRRNIETLFITFLKDTFDKFGKKLKRRDEKNVFFLFSRLHAGLQSQLKESFRTADRSKWESSISCVFLLLQFHPSTFLCFSFIMFYQFVVFDKFKSECEKCNTYFGHWTNSIKNNHPNQRYKN
jgi:hypothetical protein